MQCRSCGTEMLTRKGPFGTVLAGCPNNCPPVKAARDDGPSPFEGDGTTGLCCSEPNCKGEIEQKTGRRGKYYACSLHPESCRAAFKYPPLVSGGPQGDNKCPKCQGLLLYTLQKEGAALVACSVTGCEFSQKANGSEVVASVSK